MVDKINVEARSRIMASIKGKDTKIEMIIRRSLHALGYRYRLHVKDMPGKPDLVFPKYNAVILINGCFWHGHNCHIFNIPKSRTDYWKDKIERNKDRDKRNKKLLLSLGWRVATIWECAIFGKTNISVETVVVTVSQWLKSGQQEMSLEGKIPCQAKIERN